MDICNYLDFKKAEDIMLLDVGTVSAFADYLIIATGNSQRQVKALSDDIKEKMESFGLTVKSIEGKNDSGWILMDYGDIIINLFIPELRDAYKLESVWGKGEIVEFC